MPTQRLWLDILVRMLRQDRHRAQNLLTKQNGVLRQIDGALLRAAAGLGANPWRVFRQVVLPLSLPGVVVGMLLVFVLSLGFYITPALVGGPRDTMLSMLITQQVDLLNWPYAAALSTTLLAVALTLIGVALRLPALRQALSGVAR